MKKLIKKISVWWGGKLINPKFDDPFIIMMPYYIRPKTRVALTHLLNHWKAHWKFWIGLTVSAAVALYAAYIPMGGK